ncbi:hypothetical protein COO60DRAFT_1627481 [Scenedesmus sp. NREL 46B-D3]|nr:hypothetical protein COO60DRAFT_1627481 [Scenedesmus sp. NREL 46B-D3]
MLLLSKAQDVIKAEGEKKKDVIAVASLAEPAAKSAAAKPAGNAKSSAPAKPAAQPADKPAAQAAKPSASKPGAQPKPAQPKAKPQQQPRPAMTATRKATPVSRARPTTFRAAQQARHPRAAAQPPHRTAGNRKMQPGAHTRQRAGQAPSKPRVTAQRRAVNQA